MNERQEEFIIRAVSRSMPVGEPSVFDVDSDEYYDFAKALVEPDYKWEDKFQSSAIEAYQEFQGNQENWARWARDNFGESWGKIADVVNENGW